MASILAIDFGTTNTRAAFIRNGRLEVVRDADGYTCMPSCVAFTDAKRLYGHKALEQIARDPCNSAYEMKRLIGYHFSDAVIKSDLKCWGFRVGKTQDRGLPRVNVQYRSKRPFFPIQIAAMLMRQMKENAEKMLGEQVEEVIISVPASFNTFQRKAMEEAVSVAGLSIRRSLNDPTAIAVAHYYKRKRMPENAEMALILDVRWRRLFRLLDRLRSSTGTRSISSTGPAPLLFRLRRQCEQAKIALSAADVTSTSIELKSPEDEIDFHAELTREKFEELAAAWFAKIDDAVRAAIRTAQVEPTQIGRVLLSGGSTRILKLQRNLNHLLGLRQIPTLHSDTAVLNGCALFSSKMGYWKRNSRNRRLAVAYEVTNQAGVRVSPPLVERFRPLPFTATVSLPPNVNLRMLEVHEVSCNGREAVIPMNLGRLQLLESQWIRLVFNVDVDGILDVQAEADADRDPTNPLVMHDELHPPTAVRKMIEEAERDAKWDAGAPMRESVRRANETSASESGFEESEPPVRSPSEPEEDAAQAERSDAREKRRDPDFAPDADAEQFLPSYARGTYKKRRVGTNPNNSTSEHESDA
ncbi:Heat shock protein 70 [Aphelenchoides fujianensis]|nr:Heat shock protein 70 [Aphelenchoides fujianensis]